jgi:hypothetical protein
MSGDVDVGIEEWMGATWGFVDVASEITIAGSGLE